MPVLKAPAYSPIPQLCLSRYLGSVFTSPAALSVSYCSSSVPGLHVVYGHYREGGKGAPSTLPCSKICGAFRASCGHSQTDLISNCSSLAPQHGLAPCLMSEKGSVPPISASRHHLQLKWTGMTFISRNVTEKKLIIPP